MASVDEFVYLLAASETQEQSRRLSIPHLVRVILNSEASLYDTIDYVISETATHAPFPDIRPTLIPIREAFADFIENVASAWDEAAQLLLYTYNAIGTQETPYDPTNLRARIQATRDLLPYLDSVLENIKDLLTRQRATNDWFFLKLIGIPSAWDKARSDLPHAISLLHRLCRETIECLVALERCVFRLTDLFADWEWVRKLRRDENLRGEVYRNMEVVQTPVLPLRTHVDQLRRHPKLELSKRADQLKPGEMARLSMSSIASSTKGKGKAKTVLAPSELLAAAASQKFQASMAASGQKSSSSFSLNFEDS
ncbi:hypothetical protein BDZ89DRAFT_1158782 [Hymenopellis radicata]|nr:hypothetical protein BDZ89DRAFT_1158782 [Hymenopellis radicata]